MDEREVAWKPERQEALQAAEEGELHWFNPCGLGGSYLCRDHFVFGPDSRHPVRLLVMAQALVHGEHEPTRPGRRRVHLTSAGRKLLAKWRARPI